LHHADRKGKQWRFEAVRVVGDEFHDVKTLA